MSYQEKEQLAICLKKFMDDRLERDVQLAINNFVLLLAALSIPTSTALNIISGGNVSDVPRRSPLCWVRCSCNNTFHLTLGQPKKMEPRLQVFGKLRHCVNILCTEYLCFYSCGFLLARSGAEAKT